MPSKKCEHGRQKRRCVDCGGCDICEHKKRRSRCKDCGASEFCEHDKRKSNCKDCKGGSICKHNKQKNICIECGPNYFCIHKKRKELCADCKGISICEHKKQRSKCKDCEGSCICEHYKIKYYCKECDGRIYCIHEKEKRFCKECDGSGYCIHDIQKKSCKLCNKNIICIHNKRKLFCKECNGKRLCKSSWCSTTASKKYEKYCLYCFIHLFPDKEISRNYKTKEKSVVDYIKKEFPDLTWIIDKKVIDGCSKRRPDLLVDLGYQIIIIEVDENQHINYDTTCENKRLMELSQDNGFRPIIFIRFNPDDYIDNNSKKITSCWSNKGLCTLKKSKMNEWDDRLNSLKKEVNYWLNNNTEKTIQIKQLFYDSE